MVGAPTALGIPTGSRHASRLSANHPVQVNGSGLQNDLFLVSRRVYREGP